LYSLKKVSETAAAAAVGEGAEVQETDIEEVKGQKSSLLLGRIQDEVKFFLKKNSPQYPSVLHSFLPAQFPTFSLQISLVY
jgi:hypothetical protein